MIEKIRQIRKILEELSAEISTIYELKSVEAQSQIWKVRDEIRILERKLEKLSA